MVKSIKIITSKSSLYRKLNDLHFKKEIPLDNNETKYIEKIIKNINAKQTNVVRENRNGKVFLKKLNPINFNVFYKKCDK